MAKPLPCNTLDCPQCLRREKRIKLLKREKTALKSKIARLKAPTVFNEKEVAARLGLSVKTLQNWRIAEKGPRYHKIGRSVRYRLGDIIAYEESLTTGAGNFN